MCNTLHSHSSLADEIKWYCSVHNDKIAKSYRKNFRGNWYDKSKTPRNGVHKEIYKRWLFKNNWQWRALQNFDPSDGHKKFYDLPKQGRIIGMQAFLSMRVRPYGAVYWVTFIK